MKGFVLLIAALFLLSAAGAQIYSNPNPGLYGIKYNRFLPIQVLHLPHKTDSTLNTVDSSSQIFEWNGNIWYYANGRYFKLAAGNGFDSTAFVKYIDSTLKYTTPTQLNDKLSKASNLKDLQDKDSARVNLKIEGAAVTRLVNWGANQTILSTDRNVFLAKGSFDASHYTWTLPAANSVAPGYRITLGDLGGSYIIGYGISIVPSTGDTLSGGTFATGEYTASGWREEFVSDGSHNWTYDRNKVPVRGANQDVYLNPQRLTAQSVTGTDEVYSPGQVTAGNDNYNAGFTGQKFTFGGLYTSGFKFSDGTYGDVFGFSYGTRKLYAYAYTNTDTTKFLTTGSDGEFKLSSISAASVDNANKLGGKPASNYVPHVAGVDSLENTPSTWPTVIVDDSLRGGTFIYYASGLTLDSGTVFPCVTGGYWKRQYNQSYGLNPLWFGAKGDYNYKTKTGTDDYTALQLCLKAASNGTVFMHVPARKWPYCFGSSQPLTLGQSAKIQGDGRAFPVQYNPSDTLYYNVLSALYFYAGTSGINTDTTGSFRVQMTEVRDIAILGTGPNNNSTGLDYITNPHAPVAGNPGNMQVSNVYVDGFSTCINAQRCDTWWVNFCSLTNARVGIRNGLQDGRILNNDIWACDTAIAIKGLTNAVIDNEIEPIGEGHTIGMGLVLDSTQFNTVTNNVFKTITTAIYITKGTSGRTNFHHQISQNQIYNNSATGIYIDSGVTRVQVTENHFYRPLTTSVYLKRVQNVKVQQNLISAASPTWPNMIVDSSTLVSVENNNDADFSTANKVVYNGTNTFYPNTSFTGLDLRGLSTTGINYNTSNNNTSLSSSAIFTNTSTAFSNYANGQLLVWGVGAGYGSSNGSTRMTFNSSGQLALGNGTNTIPASSLLYLQSTTQGFAPPRMTTAQRTAISSPVEGLMVYDTDLHKLYVYDGTTWQAAW